MEKLLHTRLRNYSKQCLSSNRIQEIEGTIHLGDLLDKWADEIERYYIPRPRFEDGTPMHLGDMCDFGDYFDKDEQVKEIFGLHYVNDGEWSIQPLNESYKARLDNGKRPTPKVLDADGVEIKAGDTVYNLENDGEQGTVRCFYSYGVGVEWAGGWRSDGVNPKYLTHKEPDSLEKLKLDMTSAIKKVEGIFWECDRHVNLKTVKKWRDRLTALMERDA